jgi:hypothetical protein
MKVQIIQPIPINKESKLSKNLNVPFLVGYLNLCIKKKLPITKKIMAIYKLSFISFYFLND